MLYTIFMRKTKGDRNPFAISGVLNSYFKNYGEKNDIVIAFPGYMSKVKNNVDEFIRLINFPTRTYFTVGMNGNQLVKPFDSISIQNSHNNHKRFNFDVVGLNDNNTDHAKMLFILNNPTGLKYVRAKDLLSMDVKAVLLGSSNQSYSTYFSEKADKGEADLLLINGDYLKNTNKSKSQDKEILKFFNNIDDFYKLEKLNFRENDNNFNNRPRGQCKYIPKFSDFIKNLFKLKKHNSKQRNNDFNNIALFKEFNKNTTLNLNKMFRDSIQGLL